MLARWHRKVALDTLKALVPFPYALRRAKRRLVPYKTDDAMDRGLLADGLQILSELRAGGAEVERAAVLEFGSGWHPLIPLLFHLAGAGRVKMADKVQLMDSPLIFHAMQFIEHSRMQLVSHGLKLPDAWSMLADTTPTFPQLLDALRLDYEVPFEIADLGDQSVDIIVSRAVLEHISPSALVPLFAHFRRVLKPHGYMCHVVDNTDHYAHADPSINYVNFLRFEEWQWRLLTLNAFSYTNRLRHSDYHRLFREAGFEIVRQQTHVDSMSLEALESMRVAARFRERELQELAIATSLFVAMPADVRAARSAS